MVQEIPVIPLIKETKADNELKGSDSTQASTTNTRFTKTLSSSAGILRSKQPFLKPSGATASRQQQARNVTFPLMNSPQRIASPSSLSAQRKKVSLKPGHSASDWESLKSKKDLRKIDPSSFPLRITKEELKKHKKSGDFWISLGNKVYNITDYVNYHPGGAEILEKCSGIEALVLFNKYHRWVNYERILDACFIGFLSN